MVYTEIKEKNGRKYYYRVKSVKSNKKVNKERIYLGVNLSKEELKKKEKEADKKLNVLDVIMTSRIEDIPISFTIKLNRKSLNSLISQKADILEQKLSIIDKRIVLDTIKFQKFIQIFTLI